MKRVKSPIGFVAMVLAFAGAFAFTHSPQKVVDVQGISTSYFELTPTGNKLDRTDWVLSEPDEDCPTDPSAIPCRIQAEKDPSGLHPSAASFTDIVTHSTNFTTAYPAKVSYVPEP